MAHYRDNSFCFENFSAVEDWAKECAQSWGGDLNELNNNRAALTLAIIEHLPKWSCTYDEIGPPTWDIITDRAYKILDEMDEDNTLYYTVMDRAREISKKICDDEQD